MGRSGAVLRPYGWNLVASYGFSGFFFLGGDVAVAIAVAITVDVTISSGGGDAYWLARVGKIGWDGFGDVAY